MPENQGFLLVFPSFVYLPIYFIWLALDKRHKKKKLQQLYEKLSTSEEDIELPKTSPLKGLKLHLHFLGLGFVGGLVDTFITFANPFVSADLQAIITQMGLPLTIILVRLFGVEKFNLTKIVGGTVVLAGTLIGVIPPMIVNGGPAGSVTWIIIFILATVPQAIYNVWLEVLFQRYDIDLIELVAWSNFYESVLCVLALPLSLVKPFGNEPSFKHLIIGQIETVKCIFGKDESLGCTNTTWFYFFLYLLFVILYLYTESKVIEKESATFQVICSTLFTPATAIFFSIRQFAGSNTEDLSWNIITALVVIIIGMIIYKFSDIKKPPPVKEKENLTINHT